MCRDLTHCWDAYFPSAREEKTDLLQVTEQVYSYNPGARTGLMSCYIHHHSVITQSASSYHHHCYCYYHFQLLFNQTIFHRLLQVRPGPASSSKTESSEVFSLRFDSHFPGEYGLAGFIGAKDDGDNGSYKTCKTPLKMSPPTNQHPTFFTGTMPFPSPNQQCQSTVRQKISYITRAYNAQAHLGVFSRCLSPAVKVPVCLG